MTAASLRALSAVAVLVLASGCATVAPGGKGDTPVASVDPWESFNRKVFSFNDTIDTAVLKPVAETYRKVVPKLIRTGIDNFLGNIYDVWSTANHFLQGKLQTGMEMGMRVITNTVFGLGGILDPATEFRLPRRSEDFGQTLGHWGLASGPYLVLPLLGPSTVRDAGGLLLDRSVAPSQLPDSREGRYGVAAVEVVNIRTNLLDTGNLVDQVALDKYTFFRDAYLARRRDAVYDGAPPMETFSDIGDSDPAQAAAAAGSAPSASAAAAAKKAAPAASGASGASGAGSAPR